MFEPVCVVALGKVGAIVCPSTLFASEGSFDQCLGAIEHGPQLQRFSEVGIECWPVIVDAGVRVSRAKPRDALLCLGQTLRVADDRGLVHQQCLQFVAKIGRSPLVEADGPLWFRGYAQWTDEEGEKVTVLLKRLGAERFVTAHTPQPPGILPRFANRVFLIDTGMLTSVYKGRPSALELQDGTITAIYTDQRQVLSATTVR